MNAQQMWETFSKREASAGCYSAWSFGDQSDILAQLVLEGTKTATSSLELLYEREEEPLPQQGEYSVILDSRGEAVCVIYTTRVYTVPFSQVSQKHAWKEGEGDRSLPYWRQVHESFFRRELAEEGEIFDPECMVVCEEFMRVFP